MRNPVRITVAFDEEASALFEEMKKEMKLSQSELIRRALRFYHENKAIADISMRKRLYSYMDMLLCGEHVILDVDHWLLLLKLIETSPEKDRFWEECKEVARSHAEQLTGKVRTVEDLLDRLETCNFYRMNKHSESDFTLILASEAPKEFVKTFLEGVFAGMGFKAEVKENLAKLRVKVTEL